MGVCGFCNVWVCVRVGVSMCRWGVCMCGVLVIYVLVFTVFYIVLLCFFVLFGLCIFIINCFVCISVRTAATE